MITALAIAIPAAVFLGGCAAILRHKYRDEDPAPFNWQGTVPAAPGHCSCGAPHAAKLAPFPGDTPVLAAPAAEPGHAAWCRLGQHPPAVPCSSEPEPEPEPAVEPVPAGADSTPRAAAAPGYVTAALGGHDNADDFLASAWKKIDGQRLAEQIRDGSL
jgi:hypothetical protein